MKNWLFLSLFLFFPALTSAQEIVPEEKDIYEYKFRLFLKDKGQTPYTVDKPEAFLTAKAIERRQRQGINIDQTDLPISTNYFKAIEDLGGIIVAKSKWQKTISVHCADSAMVDALKALPFVDSAMVVWRGRPQKIVKKEYPDSLSFPNKKEIVFGDHYAYSKDNIKPFAGDTLHRAGFKGQGMDIAVIDAGFSHLPSIELFNKTNIKGYKGFVYGNDDMFNTGSQHGLMVLSCIGINKPLLFVGTAPEADFWLFGTEDERSEFPIEEDYWANAVEYADSVGVDVANTSLGYNNFDYPTESYTHADLDGKKAYISRSAYMAAQKGMLLVISAGNSGDSSWRKITPPGDARDVLTVGAIRRDSVLAPFSSRGPSADMRVKPDVVALGSSSVVVNNMGLITFASGTSFSSPITTGIVACLWQAYPQLTNKEIIKIVQESSHRYDKPNDDFGYGIPNMPKAMKLAAKAVKRKGKNVVGYSDNFRIESDKIGEVRVVYVGDKPLTGECTFILSKKQKSKVTQVDSFVLPAESTSFEQHVFSNKAKEKELYILTITGVDVEEVLNLYF